MKRYKLYVGAAIFFSSIFNVQAQLVVNDPANTKVNTLIHMVERASLKLSEEQTARIKEQLELARRYEELLQSVPEWLLGAPKLKALYETETQILELYGAGLTTVTQNNGLNRKERTDILKVYSGILKKSTEAMGQLHLILAPGPEHSFTHGERMLQLDSVAKDLGHVLSLMSTWHDKVSGYLQEKRTQSQM
jgi:hypothetical protein